MPGWCVITHAYRDVNVNVGYNKIKIFRNQTNPILTSVPSALISLMNDLSYAEHSNSILAMTLQPTINPRFTPKTTYFSPLLYTIWCELFCPSTAVNLICALFPTCTPLNAVVL